MTTIKGTKQEKFNLYNTLVCLPKALEGCKTVVDLRDDSCVVGTVDTVDGFMNIILVDCVYVDAQDNEFAFESFHVQRRNVRYIHIPESKSNLHSRHNQIICCCRKLNNSEVNGCISWDMLSSVRNSSQALNNGTRLMSFLFSRKVKKKIVTFRSMSRFSANNIMYGSDILRFVDYDCIGFDLDNTLCHYNIANMVKMEYEVLVKFLVEEKGYEPTLLYEPFEKKLEWVQKGLIIDLKKGNVLKLDDDAVIIKACHGYKELSEKEIIEIYGPSKQWNVGVDYINDMLSVWNGPKSEEIRALLDYFDLPTSLIFIKCVETIDRKKGGKQDEYRIWPDVLDGLVYMFSREHFAERKGGYFQHIIQNPQLYYQKTSTKVIEWLKELKKENKILFTVTGSNVDFANFTGEHCLGADWQNLFDVVIYYSRKPGFFVGDRPFYKYVDNNEVKVNQNDLILDACYSQGNWKGLYELFKKELGKNPKCLYIGDNLVQDVYTPSYSGHCDTVAISEEMTAEGIKDITISHKDADLMNSAHWGSYFSVHDCCGVKIPTLWCDIIRKYSKMCIPSLEAVASLPIDYKYLTFSQKKLCTAGFFPGSPKSLN